MWIAPTAARSFAVHCLILSCHYEESEPACQWVVSSRCLAVQKPIRGRNIGSRQLRGWRVERCAPNSLTVEDRHA